MSATITPDLAGFREAAADGRRVISVWTRLLADDVTPIGLYHHLCGTRTNTFLLESAEAGVWARYSIVGVDAAAVLSERNGQAHWTGRELANLPTGGDPLDEPVSTPEDEVGMYPLHRLSMGPAHALPR